MNNLEFSQQTKKEAQEILDSSDVANLLSKFGDVRIGGSFYTDLMYGPDIDVTVVTKTPRDSAIKFLNEVITNKLFQKYQYGDFENFPRKNRPKDHIVVLILPYKDRKWEIEIWFRNISNKEQIELENKLKNLPAETKLQIINKKSDRGIYVLSKHNLSSFEIYQEYV